MISIHQFLLFSSLFLFNNEALGKELNFKSCSVHGPDYFEIESVTENAMCMGSCLTYEVTAWPVIDIPSAASYHVTVTVFDPAARPGEELFFTEDVELVQLIRGTSHHLVQYVPFTLYYHLPPSFKGTNRLPNPMQIRWEIFESYTYATAACFEVETNSTNLKPKPKPTTATKSFFHRIFG